MTCGRVLDARTVEAAKREAIEGLRTALKRALADLNQMTEQATEVEV
ncbi:MAG TPA: hypothetical protein VN688_01530 [Gemmataceae bacterium]|nr:hypothetical protein [Gemmataceae bacterium]